MRKGSSSINTSWMNRKLTEDAHQNTSACFHSIVSFGFSKLHESCL